jgi:hemerythrin-like domain-containing protein
MKITHALRAEHTIFLVAFTQIERVLPSLNTPAEVRSLASLVEGMLQNHAAREASLAFLALDHTLVHHGQLTRMHQDHREIDERLRKVQQAKTCAEARRLLKAAIASSREHFELEEKAVFPLLETVLKPETLEELGATWLQRDHELVSQG